MKDLVILKIKHENTLILIAIPMSGKNLACIYVMSLIPLSSDDIENQQAVRLTKDADPTSARTIGQLIEFHRIICFSNLADLGQAF